MKKLLLTMILRCGATMGQAKPADTNNWPAHHLQPELL
jgi:hypothetical protein